MKINRLFNAVKEEYVDCELSNKGLWKELCEEEYFPVLVKSVKTSVQVGNLLSKM